VLLFVQRVAVSMALGRGLQSLVRHIGENVIKGKRAAYCRSKMDIYRHINLLEMCAVNSLIIKIYYMDHHTYGTTN
jgi:hypothetical protein